MMLPIDQAIEKLKRGELVAMPTETVYGLAAPIDQPEALAKIFSTKKRPFFDPLIVHVSSKEMAVKLTTDWSPLVDFLAEHFWPGPLTLVLPKSAMVSSVITSGLDTVGIRMPSHSVALSLIEKMGVPLAAPSANRFGRTSPTTADHVRAEFNTDQVYVLDGGASAVGIESTVLLIKRQGVDYKLSILREGFVTKAILQKSLSAKKWNFEFVDSVSKKESPGHMKHHYMPSIPLILIQDEKLSNQQICELAQQKISQLPEQIEGVSMSRPQQMQKYVEMSLPESSALAARQLYSELRLVAEQPADFILFRLRSYHFSEDWKAVMDRLTKAASLIL